MLQAGFSKRRTIFELFPLQLIEKTPQLRLIEEKKETFPKMVAFFPMRSSIGPNDRIGAYEAHIGNY